MALQFSAPRCTVCLRKQQPYLSNIAPSTRNFTTTPQTLAPPRTNPLRLLAADAPPIPPYPYPAAQWYKQSDRGLYGGRVIQFGNNISEETETKTRRVWHPNIVAKNIYSRALGRYLRLKVSTRVLRTMDKVGGLDEYLVGGKASRIKELGVEGWRLRWAVLNAPGFKKRLNSDERLRRMLGEATASTPAAAVVTPVSGRKRETLAEDDFHLDNTAERRILGQSFMDEAPVPPPSGSIWQRISQAVTRPFRRG